MPRPQRAKIERLREDLGCPHCDYRLKGLPGDVVRCPECGTECDLPKLMLRRWIGPWYRAPGFNRIIRPLVWPGIGVWIALFILVLEIRNDRWPVWTTGFAVVVLAGWLHSMWVASKVMPGSRALWLAALAHVLFGGYLVAVIGSLWLIVAFFVGSPTWGAILVAGLAPMAGLAYLCRKGEKFIAERCIRQYLIEAAAPTAPPAASMGSERDS